MFVILPCCWVQRPSRWEKPLAGTKTLRGSPLGAFLPSQRSSPGGGRTESLDILFWTDGRFDRAFWWAAAPGGSCTSHLRRLLWSWWACALAVHSSARLASPSSTFPAQLIRREAPLICPAKRRTRLRSGQIPSCTDWPHLTLSERWRKDPPALTATVSDSRQTGRSKHSKQLKGFILIIENGSLSGGQPCVCSCALLWASVHDSTGTYYTNIMPWKDIFIAEWIMSLYWLAARMSRSGI